MTTVRRWPLLLLLGVLIDLANPGLPGVFSLLNGDLFMDGVTHAHGRAADARCAPRCPSVPPAVAPRHTMATASVRPFVVRDQRRAHERPSPRRMLAVTANAVTGDTDDH